MNTTQSNKTSLSRRDFLKRTGSGLTFAVTLGPFALREVANTLIDGSPSKELTAWVHIDPDDSILIYGPADEMGQGSLTAVPVILAEFMDADWDRVRLELSPTEPETFGSGPRDTMMTGGSRSVRTYWPKVRQVGAQIRQVLLQNAARMFDVPVDELATEPSVVVHASSGRRLTYGAIAAAASVPDTIPEVPESAMKRPGAFRIIGASVPRADIPSKTDGSIEFGIDLSIPGMLHGMIRRTPVNGNRPVSFNESDIRSMPGIVEVVRLEHGVGVIGESLRAVLDAHEALNVRWSDDSPMGSFTSEAALAAYADVATDPESTGRTVHESGDARGAMSRAVRTYTADYLSDHVYHAQFEPLCAIASVDAGGASAEVWAGTQSPWSARTTAAQVLGVSPERITLNRRLSGGGFGRRLSTDYIGEAVELSNAVKRPVKLMWTREDDVAYGYFRPSNLQRMTAGVDADGRIIAWTHEIVGDNPGLLAGGAQIPHYAIGNQAITVQGVPSGARLSAWRAVAHPFNKYAIEAFLDEVARGERQDPNAYRRSLMRESPKARTVYELALSMAESAGPVPDGRARGSAFAERDASLAAAVVELSLDASNGRIRVHRAWLAGDFGIIVHPDAARAQMEGGFVFGLSSVMTERISFENGAVEQSNFSNYRLLSMSETPHVEVQFLPSEEPPTGIGELANPLAGGAVANAFAALTGKRLRHTPFTPDRVSEVLGRS